MDDGEYMGDSSVLLCGQDASHCRSVDHPLAKVDHVCLFHHAIQR